MHNREEGEGRRCSGNAGEGKGWQLDIPGWSRRWLRRSTVCTTVQWGILRRWVDCYETQTQASDVTDTDVTRHIRTHLPGCCSTVAPFPLASSPTSPASFATEKKSNFKKVRKSLIKTRWTGWIMGLNEDLCEWRISHLGVFLFQFDFFLWELLLVATRFAVNNK